MEPLERAVRENEPLDSYSEIEPLDEELLQEEIESLERAVIEQSSSCRERVPVDEEPIQAERSGRECGVRRVEVAVDVLAGHLIAITALSLSNGSVAVEPS